MDINSISAGSVSRSHVVISSALVLGRWDVLAAMAPWRFDLSGAGQPAGAGRDVALQVKNPESGTL